MGVITPNIGIYIAADGETNYGASFASGMINVDQHDHSGGPNKGVPISGSGITKFSIHYDNLNPDVVDTNTGLGVSSTLPNQIQIVGLLASINTLGLTSSVGFLATNGTVATSRTFVDSATIAWTHGNGTVDNPSASVITSGLGTIGVSNGGTGVNTLNPYDVLIGGTTNTGPIQQVAGEGNAAQVLTSQGPLMPPIWSSLPNGILLTARLNLNQTQMNNLATTSQLIVAAPGAGNIIIPISLYAKTNIVSPWTTLNNTITLCYGVAGTAVVMSFKNQSFFSSTSFIYWGTNIQGGAAIASVENTGLYLSNGAFDLAGGAGSTCDFLVEYLVLAL